MIDIVDMVELMSQLRSMQTLSLGDPSTEEPSVDHTLHDELIRKEPASIWSTRSDPVKGHRIDLQSLILLRTHPVWTTSVAPILRLVVQSLFNARQVPTWKERKILIGDPVTAENFFGMESDLGLTTDEEILVRWHWRVLLAQSPFESLLFVSLLLPPSGPWSVTVIGLCSTARKLPLFSL